MLDFVNTPLTETIEKWDERRERLLNLHRSHPIQPKYSKIRVQKYEDGSYDHHVEWRVDQRKIDELNDAVPNSSLYFDYTAMSSDHLKHSKTRCNWMEYMNDRNLSSRHEVNEAISNRYRGTYGGRWRLFDALPDYAEPWKTLAWEDIRKEYGGEKNYCGAITQYIKHLQRRHEGEVALSWEVWDWSEENLPRETVLWHPQFAKKKALRGKLQGLQNAELKSGGHLFRDSVELSAFGDTTILTSGCGGHLRLKGGAITLMELFAKFGGQYTAQELFSWYYNAQKMVKKRAHYTGSGDVRAAAQMRLQEYGHYGHRDKW